jgi:hypothetical protein
LTIYDLFHARLLVLGLIAGFGVGIHHGLLGAVKGDVTGFLLAHMF